MIYDAIVVGGGHNGLVAAAYLGRAGKRVLLLERLGQLGGAAVSAQVFDGVDARLSRYSYLVSLLPPRIVGELGAPIRLARRRYSSYTPDPACRGRRGLLIGPESAHRPGFGAIGADADETGYADFYRRCRLVTTVLWPTLLEPLPTRSQARNRVGDDAAWQMMVDEPIGHAIRGAVSHDLVRGLITTDALIGTFARADDESLRQNICFLYHVLGGGDWDVPIGGMGAVTSALSGVALLKYGAEIIVGAEVFAIDPDGEVCYRVGGEERRAHGKVVLAGVTPAELARLLGDPVPACAPGSQVKMNLMLRRLPRIADRGVTAEQAFGGTFHVNESFSHLEAAYWQAAGGAVPDPLPCEIYCHSLTDPSILSADLRSSGAQTLTVFGLHTPHLSSGHQSEKDGLRRRRLTDAVLSSMNSVLAEPIQDVLMQDAAGRDCIEVKTTSDLQRTLGMTAGNIFHGALTWPFAEDDETIDTPARRWGVATSHDRVMLCGAGSRRGGGVSGIGGHNAAMAVLQS